MCPFSLKEEEKKNPLNLKHPLEDFQLALAIFSSDWQICPSFSITKFSPVIVAEQFPVVTYLMSNCITFKSTIYHLLCKCTERNPVVGEVKKHKELVCFSVFHRSKDFILHLLSVISYILWRISIYHCIGIPLGVKLLEKITFMAHWLLFAL